jgi:hypothetical protein
MKRLFRKQGFFCFSDHSNNMCEYELEGQQRKKLQGLIPAPHWLQESHHEGTHRVQGTNLHLFIILVPRESASHALTAGKTITSIQW